jgi:hypothetical protein
MPIQTKQQTSRRTGFTLKSVLALTLKEGGAAKLSNKKPYY